MQQLPSGSYFITGTDTDVGKTVVTRALLESVNKQGLSSLAYKPISAGCEQTNSGLRNSDALILQNSSSIKVDYQFVNPIAFLPPIAPHIAAAQEAIEINIDTVSHGFNRLKEKQADVLFVEGAGGWHLPVNNSLLLSDWVIEQGLDVIVVVGLKLGCLNHALLTVQSIQQSGLKVAGWIANHISPDMPYAQENISSLKELINAPLLAEIPFIEQVETTNLSQYIQVDFV